MALGFYRGLGAGLGLGAVAVVALAGLVGMPERLRPAIPLADPPITETEQVAVPKAAVPPAPLPPADPRIETTGPGRLAVPAPAETLAPPRPGQSTPAIQTPGAPGGLALPSDTGDNLPTEPEIVQTPTRAQAQGIGLPGTGAPRAAPVPAGEAPQVATTAPRLVQPLPEAPARIPDSNGFDPSVNSVGPSTIGAPAEGDNLIDDPATQPGAAPDVGLDIPELPQAPVAPLGPDASLNLGGQSFDISENNSVSDRRLQSASLMQMTQSDWFQNYRVPILTHVSSGGAPNSGATAERFISASPLRSLVLQHVSPSRPFLRDF